MPIKMKVGQQVIIEDLSSEDMTSPTTGRISNVQSEYPNSTFTWWSEVEIDKMVSIDTAIGRVIVPIADVSILDAA